MLLLFLHNVGFGEPIDFVADETIIVEASRDREVFVAPVNLKNYSRDIEAYLNASSPLAYASTHYRNAKISNGTGGYEPYLLNHDPIKFYDSDTIKYAWDNCDYSVDYRKCSYQNNHYFLETNVTVSNEEFVIQMILFDSDFQIVSQGTVSRKKDIKWIRQQETTVIQNQTRQGTQTVTHRPKEELPLKWEIPHRIFNYDMHQASLMVWSGVKLKE